MQNQFPALYELLKEIEVLEKILDPFPNLAESDIKLAQAKAQSLSQAVKGVQVNPLIAEEDYALQFKNFTSRFRAAVKLLQQATLRERKAVIEEKELEGWLHKQGKKNPTIQHKRWFRKKGEFLEFFLQPSDPVPSGKIDLVEIITVGIYVESVTKKTIKLSLTNRDYYLVADSEKNAMIWVNAIADWAKCYVLFRGICHNTDTKCLADVDLMEKMSAHVPVDLEDQEAKRREREAREERERARKEERKAREQERIAREKEEAERERVLHPPSRPQKSAPDHSGPSRKEKLLDSTVEVTKDLTVMSIHVMTLGLTAAAGISKKDIFREHSTPSTASQGPDRGTMTYAKTCKNLMEYQQELMNKEIQERTLGELRHRIEEYTERTELLLPQVEVQEDEEKALRLQLEEKAQFMKASEQSERCPWLSQWSREQKNELEHLKQAIHICKVQSLLYQQQKARYSGLRSQCNEKILFTKIENENLQFDLKLLNNETQVKLEKIAMLKNTLNDLKNRSSKLEYLRENIAKEEDSSKQLLLQHHLLTNESQAIVDGQKLKLQSLKSLQAAERRKLQDLSVHTEKLKFLQMSQRSHRLAVVWRSLEKQRKAADRKQRQEARKQVLTHARCTLSESEDDETDSQMESENSLSKFDPSPMDLGLNEQCEYLRSHYFTSLAMSYKLKIAINKEKVPNWENFSIGTLYDKCLSEKVKVENWPQWLQHELLPKQKTPEAQKQEKSAGEQQKAEATHNNKRDTNGSTNGKRESLSIEKSFASLERKVFDPVNNVVRPAETVKLKTKKCTRIAEITPFVLNPTGESATSLLTSKDKR